MSNLREEISNALNGFRAGNLVDNARVLLAALGYRSEKRADLVPNTAKNFVDTFGNGLSHVQFNHDNALIKQWKSVDLLFQLAEDDLNAQMRLQVSQGIDQSENAWQSYLFFAIALEDRDKPYSRSDLAKITREINKLFLMPVMVIFQHGQTLTLAVIDRRLSKKYSDRDVLEKVTLIKDISLTDTHTAHLHILEDLSQQEIQCKYKFNSFEDLHKAWRQVLKTSELNDRFYKDISSWYFYACTQVKFPRDAKNNQDSLIRLITRLMFVWFLKEKNLVPDELFNEANVKAILKSLEPSESTYYKAILQNLFFATLNTEWGNRRFSAGDNGDQNHNEFLYETAFTDSQKTFKSYFEKIPFLNGGLFECLDRKVENEPEVIIDGFGDAASSELSIPNELFFGDPKDVHLNAEFGAKGEKCKVQGIIRIFDSYKFTVTENTPLEEEVALDPELLGQVFENLLAAYNPETQKTVREQTGSFYTPREIVNYMVEESLIAYLKNQLLTENVTFLEVGKRQTDIFGNEYKAGQLTIQEQLNQNPFKGKEDELEQKLRQLLSFNDANPFAEDNAVQERLIKALDSCKILDPACGSGAFPMGVLQKMVHILAKLDPSNAHWRKQQLEREIAPLLADIQTAEKISYDVARARAIAELQEKLVKIEASFENEMDYPRKLFLIQNCIFGVDIQPIAVQISKLRFFISLIIEQKENHDEENRGISPLPNLETKFVAANTLIGLKKTQQLSIFDTQEIQAKKSRLENLRREHFFARSLADKCKKREEDDLLCREIGAILKRSKFSNVDLQDWKPYDQNASASFFDPDWMFGVRDGFDIVIGNPPYYQVPKGIFSIEQYPYSEGKDKGKQNLYKVFVEASKNLTKLESGIACMIVQSSLLCDLSSTFTRKLLLKHCSIEEIIEFPKTAPTKEGQVFKNVLQGTCIYRITNRNPSSNHFFNISTNNDVTTLENLKFESVYQHILFELYPETYYIPLIKSGDFKPINEVKKSSTPLSTLIIGISQGDLNLTSSKEYFRSENTGVKLFRGKNVQRFYLIEEVDEYISINFKPEKVRTNSESEFLVCQEVTGTTDKYRLHFCVIPSGKKYLFGHTANKISVRNKNLLKPIAVILNSKFLDWLFRKTSTNNHVMGYEITQFPIPYLIEKYSYLLTNFYCLMRHLAKHSSSFEECFEMIMNSLVFNLYFPEHMEECKIDVIRFVERDIAEVMQGKEFENLENTAKEKVIEQLYAKWTDLDNEVHKRIKLFAIRSPDILKPILESR